MFFLASNIVLMSDKAVLVDFGLTVQMTEDIYIPRDLRGTEVRKDSLTIHLLAFSFCACAYLLENVKLFLSFTQVLSNQS